MRTRDVKWIVVHCTATEAGREVSKDDLIAWHCSPRGNGWSNPGYHYLVHLDGSVSSLLSTHLVANGARGYNAHSVHVAYVGGLSKGKPHDTRTSAQKGAILLLLWMLKKQFPAAEIVGHRDLPGVTKACPCYDVQRDIMLSGNMQLTMEVDKHDKRDN